MDKDLQEKIEALRELAKEGFDTVITPVRELSSLHNIIRNKEQAERFQRKLDAVLKGK